MGHKKRTWRGRAAHLAMAAGLALSAGGANALVIPIDGVEGIGDFVWDDLDMDGIQDAGEPGIANVMVTLLRDSDKSQIGSSVMTDANGHYGFGFDETDNFAGVPLVVQFTNLPADYMFTLANQGGDEVLDSDVTDFALGRTGPVSYNFYEFNLDVDAGLYRKAAVPEPGMLALLAFGLAGLGVMRRKK